MAYKVNLTKKALSDINQTIDYLIKVWTNKEATHYLEKLEQLKIILSQDPFIFPVYDKVNAIRKAILTKHNIVYYQVNVKIKTITIITIFNVFQNPKKLEL